MWSRYSFFLWLLLVRIWGLVLDVNDGVIAIPGDCFQWFRGGRVLLCLDRVEVVVGFGGAGDV